jgi:hypothetical protein
VNVIQLALGLGALVAFLVLVAIIPSWRTLFVGTFTGRKPRQSTRV